MRVQDWIVSIHYESRRHAVIGPARAATVETALHLASVPETVRTEIRGCEIVRDFVEGRLDPDKNGDYMDSWSARMLAGMSVATAKAQTSSWAVCIGSVQAVLPNEDR